MRIIETREAYFLKSTDQAGSHTVINIGGCAPTKISDFNVRQVWKYWSYRVAGGRRKNIEHSGVIKKRKLWLQTETIRINFFVVWHPLVNTQTTLQAVCGKRSNKCGILVDLCFGYSQRNLYCRNSHTGTPCLISAADRRNLRLMTSCVDIKASKLR